MDRKAKLVTVGVGAAIAVLAVGAGIGVAASGDDDAPLGGPTYERATEAALEHVGGGTVIETETGDGGAAYGVEIRLDDGRVVEVSLDERFDVIGTEADDDGAGGEESGDSED